MEYLNYVIVVNSNCQEILVPKPGQVYIFDHAILMFIKKLEENYVFLIPTEVKLSSIPLGIPWQYIQHDGTLSSSKKTNLVSMHRWQAKILMMVGFIQSPREISCF